MNQSHVSHAKEFRTDPPFSLLDVFVSFPQHAVWCHGELLIEISNYLLMPKKEMVSHHVQSSGLVPCTALQCSDVSEGV